jgi:phage-related protein
MPTSYGSPYVAHLFRGEALRLEGPSPQRTARVLLCLHEDHPVALHGFIKKTRTTPDDDLALARKRQKELER